MAVTSIDNLSDKSAANVLLQLSADKGTHISNYNLDLISAAKWLVDHNKGDYVYLKQYNSGSSLWSKPGKTTKRKVTSADWEV